MTVTRVRLKKSKIVGDSDCVNINDFATSTWAVLRSTVDKAETIVCSVNEKDTFEIASQDAYSYFRSMYPKAEYFRVPKEKVFY